MATAIDRYAVLVRTRIQADVRVPSMVRALRERGQALVAFRLTPNGTLLWVKLRKSSGVGPIDAASLRTVKDSLYPPFTPAMPQHPMTFEVKVKISGRPRA